MSGTPRFGLRYAIALGLLGLVPRVALSEPTFAPVGPGIARASFTTAPSGRPRVEFTVLRIDPRRVHLVVVDLRHIDSDSASGDPHGVQVAYSLRELDRHLHPGAVINGGFTNSLVLPTPSGWVKVAGRETNRVNALSKVQTGVLCIDSSGKASILRPTNQERSRCQFAVQAGPIVVEDPGVNGISSGRVNDRYERSLIGIGREDLVFLIHTSTASLFDIAEALTGKVPNGLNLRVALNLDGDGDSGLLWHEGNGQTTIGNIDATIPTAIAVMSR
jgi:uncharacterized protein YigE (DUF2233 family)